MIDENEIRGVRDRVLMLRSLDTLAELQDEDLSILALRRTFSGKKITWMMNEGGFTHGDRTLSYT